MRAGVPPKPATRSTDLRERCYEYEAFRTRDISGFDIASLFMDTVYEPLRRWGSKTGVLCVWGTCVDGRKVLLNPVDRLE